MKTSAIAVAVVLGLSGAAPAAAEPIRLAQTFAADVIPPHADVIPPHEVFTIVSSMGLRPLGRPHFRGRSYVLLAVDRRGEEVRVVVDAYAARVVSVRPVDSVAEYDGPPVHRRYETLPPRGIEAGPRYAPPMGEPLPYPHYDARPADPDYGDDLEEEPDEFGAGEDETGSVALRDAPHSPYSQERSLPLLRSTRSAAVTPPKTPLPRPRPGVKAAEVEPAQSTASSPAAAAAGKESQPDSDSNSGAAKAESAAQAETKSEQAKAESQKSGIRIIEIKRPEPRI